MLLIITFVQNVIKMKKVLTKLQFFKFYLLLFFTVFTSYFGFSQGLFVGSGTEFFLKNNTEFTTNNTIVTVDFSGKFSVEAGNDWGSDQEYVDGEVTVYGDGETKLPIGNNGVYAPVFAKHTGNIIGFYSNSSPSAGTNGVDVDAVADVEYWKLTGNAIITLPWNDNSDITTLVNNNGGVLNSVSIVGYDNGVWNLVSSSQTNTVTGDLLNGDVTSDTNNAVDLNNFTQFTFGIDHQAALAIEDLFITNGINILSNPIQSIEKSIRFRSAGELNNLKVSLFDVTGRKISQHRVSTFNKVGSIPKNNVQAGVYFLRFDYEGKQGVKEIIIK